MTTAQELHQAAERLAIGTLRPDRLTCGPEHLPGCFNPLHNTTWCLCGSETWTGQVGTWHSLPRYDSRSKGARLLGWDTYFLPAPTLAQSAPTQETP